MKLYKVKVEAYYFGKTHYNTLVYAENEEEVKTIIRRSDFYIKDPESEIKSISEIELKKGIVDLI